MFDDDEKIRRNLVFASTAVLLAKVLGFKLNPVGLSIFGIATASAPSPRMFWGCTSLALSYLVARYRFDKEVSREVDNLRGTLQGILARTVHRRVSKRAKKFALTGINDSGVRFSSGSGPGWDNFIESRSTEGAKARILDVSAQHPWGKDGIVTIDGLPEPDPTILIGFTLSKPLQIQAIIETATRALFYSPLAINTLLPVILWIPAMTIALSQFARSL